MSKVNWDSAPSGANFYAGGVFWSSSHKGLGFGYKSPSGHKWILANVSLENLKSEHDYEQRPIEWPTEAQQERQGLIERNGNDGLIYEELEKVGHYDQQREQHETKQQQPLGKYDRRIKGKYSTGACTVDVYRVLSAFEITEPELQHCIKKLLAAGQRGVKDYQQDLREASVSLCMLISRLEE